MIYQEKRKKKIQVLFEDEEREGSISATDLFAEIDDFDDITDDSDDYDDDGYLPQVSDNRVKGRNLE